MPLKDRLKVPSHRRTTVRRKVSNGLGFKHLSVEVHFVKRKKSVSSLSCHKGVVFFFLDFLQFFLRLALRAIARQIFFHLDDS